MNSRTGKRKYNYRWTNYRRAFLRENPLCVFCKQLGKDTLAEVVDHIIPHRGDDSIFWDYSNHQSLCKHCHDSVKQRMESGYAMLGCGVDGMPVDSNHHWNKDNGK